MNLAGVLRLGNEAPHLYRRVATIQSRKYGSVVADATLGSYISFTRR